LVVIEINVSGNLSSEPLLLPPQALNKKIARRQKGRMLVIILDK